jgi:hypothetical protein
LSGERGFERGERGERGARRAPSSSLLPASIARHTQTTTTQARTPTRITRTHPKSDASRTETVRQKKKKRREVGARVEARVLSLASSLARAHEYWRRKPAAAREAWTYRSADAGHARDALALGAWKSRVRKRPPPCGLNELDDPANRFGRALRSRDALAHALTNCARRRSSCLARLRAQVVVASEGAGGKRGRKRSGLGAIAERRGLAPRPSISTHSRRDATLRANAHTNQPHRPDRNSQHHRPQPLTPPTPTPPTPPTPPPTPTPPTRARARSRAPEDPA